MHVRTKTATFEQVSEPKKNNHYTIQPQIKQSFVCGCYLVPVCVVIQSQKHLGEKDDAEVVDAARIHLSHPLDVFRGISPTKHLIHTQRARVFTKPGVQLKTSASFGFSFLDETVGVFATHDARNRGAKHKTENRTSNHAASRMSPRSGSDNFHLTLYTVLRSAFGSGIGSGGKAAATCATSTPAPRAPRIHAAACARQRRETNRSAPWTKKTRCA